MADERLLGAGGAVPDARLYQRVLLSNDVLLVEKSLRELYILLLQLLHHRRKIEPLVDRNIVHQFLASMCKSSR